MKTGTEHDSQTIDEQFLQFVEDAAQQDSFLALDANDWDGQKPVGAKPIYAVDSNIVHMFINPLGSSYSGKNKSIGYGEVFRSDPVEKKAAITLALADFIWHDLCPDRPLILMPGPDREVATLIQVSASQTTPPPDTINEVEELRKRLATAPNEEQRAIAQQLASRIIDIKRRGRLVALERNKRFAPVDHLLNGGGHGFSSDVLAVLSPLRQIADMLDYALLRNEWGDLMARNRGGDAERQPVSRDIDALSYLEFWNRRLLRLSTPHRLIYITGDAAILRASSQRVVDFWEPEHRPKHAGPATTFMDAFIRHPRSLLDRPGALRNLKTASSDATSLGSWLRLLLGEYQDEDGKLGQWNWSETRFELANDVKNDVLHVAKKKPEVLREAQEGWSGFTDSVSLANLIDGNMFPPGEFDAYGDRDKQYGVEPLLKWLKDHGQKLNEEVESYWRDCVLAFTEFRFLIDIISKRPPTHRRPPQLCLEGAAPQKFLAQAKLWLADSKSFNADEYGKFKNELNESDGNEYNFLVSIAFILASGSNWHSAAFLCAHAGLVAKRQNQADVPRRISGPNGREAAYLEAFSRRHLARKVEDLNVCFKLVEKAIDIYEEECANESKNLPMKSALMMRFKGERLAIHYTLEMLKCGGQIQNANITDLILLCVDFEKFLEEIKQIDETRPELKHVLELLRHRTLINIVSISVFLGPSKLDQRWDAKKAQFYSDQLKQVRSNKGDNDDFKSEYSEIVTWSGSALFGEAQQRREALPNALKGINDALLNKHVRENGFVYERARYHSFRRNLSPTSH